MQKTTMPVRPVHHRRNGEAGRLNYLILINI